MCFIFREFTDHAKHGVAMEEEWNKALEEYSRKYPEEGAEFKQLISGELPADWEKALPVRSAADMGLGFRVFSVFGFGWLVMGNGLVAAIWGG